MAHTQKINPKRLARLLEGSMLSQKELAAQIGVDAGTLSRWKRGDIKRLRANQINKLCEALRTTRTELCSEADFLDRPAIEARNRGQANFNLDTACRNALALVAHRYGVTRQEIVEVAPLMFFILAEQSLNDRRAKLQKFKENQELTENSAPAHMRIKLQDLFDRENENISQIEEYSIDERDLFGKHFGNWDRQPENNPFANFLSASLKNTGKQSNCAVVWDGYDPPKYFVGLEELSELLGSEKEACGHVINGSVALSEMPGDVRRSDPERRAAWVKEKASLNEIEIREEIKKIDLSKWSGFSDQQSEDDF